MDAAVSTSERIREAAVRRFLVDGYAGLSLQEVRRDAGVSNGSLYHHFAGKADLVAALRVDGMQECQDIVLATLAAAGSAENGVRGTVRRYLCWVEGHRELAA